MGSNSSKRHSNNNNSNVKRLRLTRGTDLHQGLITFRDLVWTLKRCSRSKSELCPRGVLKERNCPSFAGRTDYLLYLERYFTRRMYSFPTKNRKKKIDYI